ncbi:MAG: potassium/proton antiporter [Bacteroidales bacterium]|nr:potassium/proton antiporter [Bacteroidales bacterium]
MIVSLIFIAVVILLCVLLSNASNRYGVPVLLAFLILGTVFGNNTIIPLDLDEDAFPFVEKLATVALIFIMFYGGFGTSWKTSRGVAVESGVLATAGVIITAALTGLFCHFVLRWDWAISFLTGSVLSAPAAASVFSILRTRKLGLKNNTAPILEIESGSNDPCSNILTIMMIAVMTGGISGGRIAGMFFQQMLVGAAFGFFLAWISLKIIRKMRFVSSGYTSLLMLAIAILAYSVPSSMNGNGYLAAYLVGIILGNQDIPGKKELVNFFDGFTGLMQVLIFFMIGMLARTSSMLHWALPAAAIFLALLLIVRPAAMLILLLPLRKYSLRQIMLISFAGLRGASSIVFAIMAMTALSDDGLIGGRFDLFTLVFMIVLLSIGVQGSFIPLLSKKLDMIDPNADVMKTFSDFSEETDLQFSEVIIDEHNPWLDKEVMELGLPSDMRLCRIVRKDGKKILPGGHTVIRLGDHVVLFSKAFKSNSQLMIIQKTVKKGGRHDGEALRDNDKTGSQIIMIKRGDSTIIPNGNTVLRAGDLLYINQAADK